MVRLYLSVDAIVNPINDTQVQPDYLALLVMGNTVVWVLNSY